MNKPIAKCAIAYTSQDQTCMDLANTLDYDGLGLWGLR